MACLQIYRELLSLTTFFRVHSNSEQVSYLFWQKTYPNLKTTCHIKLKFFLCTKLLENLLLEKYPISVAAALNCLVLDLIWLDFCTGKFMGNISCVKNILHRWKFFRRFYDQLNILLPLSAVLLDAEWCW